MDKEFIKVICMIAFVIGMIVFIVVMIVRPPQREKCFERGLDKNCGENKRECYDDCNKLEFEYFRYETGGFASEECWCKINNGTKQIW